MAAKTPVAAGTAGYVDKIRGLYTGVRAAAEAILTVGSIDNNRTRFRQMVFYFSDIDDGDTWASGIQGIKACWWMGDTANGDACNVSLTNADGSILFETVATSDVNGWVLLMIDDQDSAHGLSIR